MHYYKKIIIIIHSGGAIYIIIIIIIIIIIYYSNVPDRLIASGLYMYHNYACTHALPTPTSLPMINLLHMIRQCDNNSNFIKVNNNAYYKSLLSEKQ